MRILLILVLSFCAFCSNAAIISFTGTFDDDNTRFYSTFSVTQSSNVIFTSLGYAGGVNGEGTIINDGGFDTQLFLFDSSGALLAQNDDSRGVESISSGNSWDAFLSLALDVDDYTIVLTQYNSDYVSGDLVTGTWTPAGVSNFVDVSGSQRTNEYAFDIEGDFLENVNGFDNDPVLAVSEPNAIFLLSLGLIFGAFRAKGKKLL